MINLWRGFHHSELPPVLKKAWDQNELVILVPLHLKDFSFFKKLGKNNIAYHGDWTEELKKQTTELLSDETDKNLNTLALGVFTSGTSTGQSRLVFYSKNNVEASLSSIRELFDTKRIKKIFCYPQPTHTFGLLLGYLHAILNNIEIHFWPGAYSREAHTHWLKVVDDKTLTLGAPTHFLDLIQFVKSQNIKVPASYSSIVGGARVSGELWEKMRSVLNIEAPSVGYGATEASPGVTHLGPGIKPSEDGDIGYALKGVEVQISEQGLEFKGPNVCAFIFENQQFKKFDKILLKDSILITKTLKSSRYTYLGRTDCMINRGGIKISLEVVESVVGEKLSAKCLAVSLFDARLGDDIGLVIQSDLNLNKKQVQEIIKNEWGFQIPESSIAFGFIPLNPNGKGDRIEATKMILKQTPLPFPISVQHLRSLLPHKGPAVWVDSILETKPRTGIVSVQVQESRNYFSGSDVRDTACIEWVAQAYGYVVAVNDILGVEKAAAVTKTYIAEVKSAEFHNHQPLQPGDFLEVKVHCTHDFGQLKVVEGQVFHKSNLLAQMSMKVYCG